MTYYAKAETSDHRSYASEVYFLEVQPFREDLLNLPGGESGSPHQALSELSSLVGRQQRTFQLAGSNCNLPVSAVQSTGGALSMNVTAVPIAGKPDDSRSFTPWLWCRSVCYRLSCDLPPFGMPWSP